MSKQSSQSQFESSLNQSLQNLPLPAAAAPQPASASSPKSSVKSQPTIDYQELKLGASKGKGAYGEVFVGEYRKEQVAIKVYDFRGQLSELEQAEIIHEAELMEGLRSKYLVGYRGICWDPRYCLVMEYCEGGTLRARLNKMDQALNLVDPLRWAQQISYGLYHLHSVKIIHRDLKGENILLDSHGDAKVADFGLSIVKSSSASQSRSGGHQTAGTLPWMAPELFDRKANNSATDVYSLGMVLWEMVSRKSPFVGLMPPVIAGMIMMGKREIIDSSWPLIFRTLIQACWDADPSKRPTAEKVGDELGAALRSIESIPKLVSKSPEPFRIERLEEKLRQAELKNQQWPQQSPSALIGPIAPVIKLPLSQFESGLNQSLQNLSFSVAAIAQNSQSLMPAPKAAVPAVDARALYSLLRLVTEGEQDKVEEMLKGTDGFLGLGAIKGRPELLLAAGSISDLSSRKFNNITAFQYALWAMDYHMWTMIRKYLPIEAQVEQFNVLESKGTKYGKHFNITPLTDALQTYIDYLDNRDAYNYQIRLNQRWDNVGNEQKMVPVHAVNEYCRRDRPFYPCPTEWESKLPRTREVHVWNGSKYVTKPWFTFEDGRFDDKANWMKESWLGGPSSSPALYLGMSFSVHRGEESGAKGGKGMGWPGKACGSDLLALQSLWKTRTEQLKLLSAECAAVSSQSQPSGLSQHLFG